MRLSRNKAKQLGIPIPDDNFGQRCIDNGIPEPICEYLFSPTRKYRFDYCWPERMLALEQEGAIYGTGKACPLCKRRKGGGHSSITGILRDIEKHTEAAILGWRIIRCTTQQMDSGEVFGLLKRAFER